MRDPEKTIGNILDKQSIVYIGSVDEDGFPNTKAMLKPRKRDGIKVFYFHTNTSSKRVSQYKFWDDNKIYFGNQLRKKGSDRCYGIIADEKYLMVSEYSGYGSDAEIVVFEKWSKNGIRKINR